MGLPQPIADALDEMEAEAHSVARAAADYKQIEENALASMAGLAKATKAYVDAVNGWLEAVGSPSTPPGIETIETIIESVRSQEAKLAEILLPALAQSREGQK